MVHSLDILNFAADFDSMHSMVYQPQESKEAIPIAQPIHERGPHMVTPLSRVGATPVEVDCPYCQKVVTTEVRQVDSGDSG